MTSAIIINATLYSKKYMSQYDGSHDFEHILRVCNMALYLAKNDTRKVDLAAVEIAALLHDINDHKYSTSTDPNIIYDLVIKFGGCDIFAKKIALIVEHVSYSFEQKNKNTDAYIAAMQIPECQIVQDADRLEAIGALGIARCFMYNGAKSYKIDGAIEHFNDKLIKIHTMMKTPLGSTIANIRAERIKIFLDWFKDENKLITG